MAATMGSKQRQALALTHHEIVVEMLGEKFTIALVLDCAVVASLYSGCVTLGICNISVQGAEDLHTPPSKLSQDWLITREFSS
jgi:hypothetical protein